MQFNDIRPYYDQEYQSVVKRLLTKDPFLKALKNYFPEYPEKKIRQLLLSCKSIKEFQQVIISSVVEKIAARSLTELTFSGLDQLDQQQSYLFLSNHRDIVLDSAFLNYGLNQAGLETSEIAIGSNLLKIDWVRDLVRINKSFIVKRNLPNQEMLEASKTLSAYIVHTLHEKKESIWIAQREGRAKDGNDQTNPGLLKMLGMAKEKDLLQHLIDLNIIPVSISYEYDPCDYLKIPELTATFHDEPYTKQADEDIQHIICGIQGFKGRTHITFGTSIEQHLNQLAGIKNRNDLLRAAALIIDRQIYQNYHLWPTNYMAADLRHQVSRFSEHYSEEALTAFSRYITERAGSFEDSSLAMDLLLEMYANPVFNKCELPIS